MVHGILGTLMMIWYFIEINLCWVAPLSMLVLVLVIVAWWVNKRYKGGMKNEDKIY